MYKPEYPGLYYFDTFTFTTLGTSGNRGPDPTKGYTDAPWNPDQFSIVDGQQQWTVPATGTYNIVAAGAYGATPGRVVSGDVDLYEGQVLSLLVGQQPTPLTSNAQDNLTVGGGGGTFVASDGTLLMVASGGDGTGGSSASFSPFGSGNGINGAGYLSNGSVTNATFQFLKPTAYLDGGFGNIYIKTVVPEEGGFGGGQSPVATSNISGGGGYTGSPGDGVSGATCYGAGTITDLGATSNHMGYVTVSLIDPAPIDLTLWSWDDESLWDNLDSFQSNVYTITWSESLGIFVTSGISAGICTSSDGKQWYNSTIPWANSVSPLVAADDKPILVLGRNTSSDGITWYLNDIPYYYADVTNTVYVNKMFISTVAPDYYTPYTGMYTSTDGYTWTTIISYELINVKAYGNSMYVGTTNVQSDPNVVEQVVYSTDLVTWNYTSIYVYDVTFANGIFIGFNGDGSVISSDGISWTMYPYMFAIIWSYPPVRQIVFGNDLFMVVSARHVYTSPDGMNWTLTKIFPEDIDVNISVTYSPSKQFFMFVPTAGVPVATLEGKYFTPLSEQIKSPVKYCAYSKPLNILVVIARTDYYSDDPIYIYTSSDKGETLLETSILYPGYQEPCGLIILWSDEFYSFFIYFATNNSGLLIFTSNDGLTWTRQNDYVPNVYIGGFNPVWYKEENWFRYISFYSSDGIIWSYSPDIPLPPSPPGYIGSNVRSPKLELFVGTTALNGISSSFDVYVSVDGINWSVVYTAYMTTVGFVGVVWAPELEKFYIYAAGYPTESNSLYLFESHNGYDWIRLPVPKVYTLDYAGGFYWFSGFDRFVVQSFQNFKGITFSSKAIKQF